MGMLRSAVNLELSEHLAAQAVLREHSLNGLLNHQLRLLGAHETRGSLPEATRVAAVVTVHLVRLLAAGQADLLGIDDDDEIPRVDIGGVDGLVLALGTMAIREAMRPSTWSLASTTNQLFTSCPCLTMNVFCTM